MVVIGVTASQGVCTLSSIPGVHRHAVTMFWVPQHCMTYWWFPSLMLSLQIFCAFVFVSTLSFLCTWLTKHSYPCNTLLMLLYATCVHACRWGVEHLWNLCGWGQTFADEVSNWYNIHVTHLGLNIHSYSFISQLVLMRSNFCRWGVVTSTCNIHLLCSLMVQMRSNMQVHEGWNTVQYPFLTSSFGCLSHAVPCSTIPFYSSSMLSL